MKISFFLLVCMMMVAVGVSANLEQAVQQNNEPEVRRLLENEDGNIIPADQIQRAYALAHHLGHVRIQNLIAETLALNGIPVPPVLHMPDMQHHLMGAVQHHSIGAVQHHSMVGHHSVGAAVGGLPGNFEATMRHDPGRALREAIQVNTPEALAMAERILNERANELTPNWLGTALNFAVENYTQNINPQENLAIARRIIGFQNVNITLARQRNGLEMNALVQAIRMGTPEMYALARAMLRAHPLGASHEMFRQCLRDYRDRTPAGLQQLIADSLPPQGGGMQHHSMGAVQHHSMGAVQHHSMGGVGHHSFGAAAAVPVPQDLFAQPARGVGFDAESIMQVNRDDFVRDLAPIYAPLMQQIPNPQAWISGRLNALRPQLQVHYEECVRALNLLFGTYHPSDDLLRIVIVVIEAGQDPREIDNRWRQWFMAIRDVNGSNGARPACEVGAYNYLVYSLRYVAPWVYIYTYRAEYASQGNRTAGELIVDQEAENIFRRFILGRVQHPDEALLAEIHHYGLQHHRFELNARLRALLQERAQQMRTFVHPHQGQHLVGPNDHTLPEARIQEIVNEAVQDALRQRHLTAVPHQNTDNTQQQNREVDATRRALLGLAHRHMAEQLREHPDAIDRGSVLLYEQLGEE